MLKPSGSLRYAVSAIAGGGGTSVKNLLVDNDSAGNHFDGPRLQTDIGNRIKVWFQALAVASSGNAAKVFPSTTTVVTAGVVTTLSVTLTNSSAAGGDTVSGTLFVEIPNKADMGL